jgi:lysophospholipase L1-like esterase/phosphoserine phosphatase
MAVRRHATAAKQRTQRSEEPTMSNPHGGRRADDDPRTDRDARGHRTEDDGRGGIHATRREEQAIGWPALALVGLTGLMLWYALTPAAARRGEEGGVPAAAGGSDAAPAAINPDGGPAAGRAPTPAAPRVAAGDPLPSWNDGATKRAIIDFVAAVTKPGGPDFVPVPERVAVFDHDGTLVCEKPIAHGLFLLDRVRDLVARQPDLAHEEPFTSLLTGDIEAVRRLGKKYFLDLTFTAVAGVPEDRLEENVRRFIAAARHPVFGVPLGETTYEPMKEVMRLLRAHDFSIWICSGSGVHFMRPVAEAWYGIGPEHVIASRAATELRETGDPAADGGPGAANRRLALVVTPQLQILNDEERKPVSIGEHVGRRPIFAAGNVGTTGDIEMLRWSQSGSRPSLQLLVLHDDAEREMAYDEPSGDSLEAAERYAWNVVRMKSDWKRIFSRPLERRPAAAAAPAPAAAAGPVSDPTRWEREVAALEAAARENPPAPGGVLFLGSSNVRMWDTLGDDFAGMNVVKRGVGGALLAELVPLATRLVGAAQPAVVVVSAGGNDINAGATPEQVRDAFARLVETLDTTAPGARVVFQAIAPSIKRWEQWERQQAANELVRGFIADRGDDSGLFHADVSAAFLDTEGKPAGESLLDDLLHPSAAGNARRAQLLRPVVERALAAPPRR